MGATRHTEAQMIAVLKQVNSGDVPSAAESLSDIDAEIPARPFRIRDRCALVTPNPWPLPRRSSRPDNPSIPLPGVLD